MAYPSRLEITVNHHENELPHALSKYKEPKILGHFSVNGNKQFCADLSQLKYVHSELFYPEKIVRMDLNHNIKDTIKKDPEHQSWNKLTHLFSWIELNIPLLLPITDPVFVTYRGNLTTIFCTPYENNEDWTICAKLCNGVIYLNSFETDKQRIRSENASDFEKCCQSWGFKFEQYVLTSDPTKKPDCNEILNENEEMCCVYERKIGNHRVIYGAEMDGILSDTVLDSSKNNNLSGVKFIELKTTRKIENQRQDRSFRKFKLLKWWGQSFIGNVDTILCGFRTDTGVVNKLKCFNVNELPKLAQGWKTDVCLNFCIRFLDFVKRIILEQKCYDNKSDIVWKFDFYPGYKKIRASTISGVSKYTDGFKEVKISLL